MVVSIFRSRLRAEHAEEFGALAAEMMAIAESMPGFVSYTVFVSDSGERCSIVEFESHQELLAWREQPGHVEAQRQGRERYYSEYSLQVCDVVRESRFEHSSHRA